MASSTSIKKIKVSGYCRERKCDDCGNVETVRKDNKEIEMMFVETERFGVTKDTEMIWRNMIRSMQSVTAFRIKEVKNATA